MWGISGVCTLDLTVAKTSSHYDRFAISVPARSLFLFDLVQQKGNISGSKGPRDTRGNGDIFEALFMLCIIPTLMILSFFFNSRILQTGLVQFVENQKQNQDNTGRSAWKIGRNVSSFFCRNVFAEMSCSRSWLDFPLEQTCVLLSFSKLFVKFDKTIYAWISHLHLLYGKL